MSIALVVVVVAACIGIAAAVHRGNKLKVSRHLHGREALADEQFALLFSSALEGKVGVSLRRLLAPRVGFDVQFIRPSDRFCADLHLGVEDGLDTNEYVESVEKEWHVEIPDEEAAELHTVAELAKAVARRVGGGLQSNWSLDTDPELVSF